MEHKFLVTYLKEQIAKYPHLKSEILDFYGLCQSEIEEGGSPTHERELCYNSVQELIDENTISEGN
jgi:hypothetical protein